MAVKANVFGQSEKIPEETTAPRSIPTSHKETTQEPRLHRKKKHSKPKKDQPAEDAAEANVVEEAPVSETIPVADATLPPDESPENRPHPEPEDLSKPAHRGLISPAMRDFLQTPPAKSPNVSTEREKTDVLPTRPGPDSDERSPKAEHSAFLTTWRTFQPASQLTSVLISVLITVVLIILLLFYLFTRSPSTPPLRICSAPHCNVATENWTETL